jgi:16S rRNA C967 or C1407 C5-methylase (RsmB/RsmF family)/NOL1/NOP2/fmu family ribosome biogenesis protein
MVKLPEAFESSLKEKLGSEFSDFLSSLNEPSPVSIRINQKKLPSLQAGDSVPWSTSGFYLPQRPVFTLDPLFHAGAYYVQEASSMFLEQAFRQLIDISKSLTVLDLSAAPGGKSTHILSLLGETSLLVSNEVIRSRASVLAENLLKWGYANTIVTNNDPEDFKTITGFFDVVVVDAPCSGEGLFRKDPAAVNEWSEQNVALCSSRQKRILADVWPSLKENGILIYSTCTYNRFENEDNMLWLQQQNDIEFLSLKINGEWGIETVEENGIRGYRFMPHRTKGEGFYISVIRKKSEENSISLKSKRRLTPLHSKQSDQVKPWLKNADQLKLFQHNEFIYFIPENKISEFEFLIQHLKMVQAGTTVATVKHDKIIPEHAFALSVNLHEESFGKIPVSIDQAISYLRRDTLNIENTEKGFHLVTFDDVPIGWVNSLGNRFNNLYPIDWRIRMAHDPSAKPAIKLK